MNSDFSRHPLAREGAAILEDAGYQTATVSLPQTEASLLVAENSYSVAAIVAADEWGQVNDQVDGVATDFVNWALSREPRAKQWDLYLCVLIAQPVTEDEQLAQIEYVAGDTRYVRRLVRHGVATDDTEPAFDGSGTERAAVRTALAALLPLRLPERISQRDPYAALTDALRSRGVDGELAERTVERFLARSEGST
jgi:hypothetical protein